MKCLKEFQKKNQFGVENCINYCKLVSMNYPSKRAIIYSTKLNCKKELFKQRSSSLNRAKKSRHKSLPCDRSLNNTTKINKDKNIKEVSIIEKCQNRNKWIKNYIKKQVTDIKGRSKVLATQINNISNFYQNMHEKYNFKSLKKNELYRKVKDLNKGKGDITDEYIYDKKINNRIEDMYKNISKVKKKFKLIDKYQKIMISFTEDNNELNLDSKHDKKMIEALKKDKKIIEEFNNSKYKFPLSHNTHHRKKISGTRSNFIYQNILRKLHGGKNKQKNFSMIK